MRQRNIKKLIIFRDLGKLFEEVHPRNCNLLAYIINLIEFKANIPN